MGYKIFENVENAEKRMEEPNSNFDSRLIALVRANPMLYAREIRATPYEAMKTKNEMWANIATSLKIDVQTCIWRWKNLRDKLRRELVKEMPGGGGSTWKLLDDMRFVEQHIKYHNERQMHVQPQNVNLPLDDMNAESLIEELVDGDDDDALQEAMDEQTIEKDKEIVIPMMHEVIVTSPMSNVSVINETDLEPNKQMATGLERIEILLRGLHETNRQRAEKRIIGYLCKCNLRSLNNETIDDIVI